MRARGWKHSRVSGGTLVTFGEGRALAHAAGRAAGLGKGRCQHGDQDAGRRGQVLAVDGRVGVGGKMVVRGGVAVDVFFGDADETWSVEPVAVS